MTIHRITWQSYRIPFRAPFATARGAVAHREGIIVRLETDDGLVGLGEASPLPQWGGGTVADVDRLLQEAAPLWLRRLSSDEKDADGDRGVWEDRRALHGVVSEPASGEPAPGGRPVVNMRAPSDLWRSEGGSALACAIATTLLDLAARSDAVRVADLLADRVSGTAADVVPVNAVVAACDDDAAAEAAAASARRGFTCVKLKVGMLGSAGAEAARVGRVRAALGPGIALRLDANGAWDAERAIETIRACEPHAIELVEQPVPADALDDLALVVRAVDTPVAADESVADPERALRVIERRAADLIVLKPMALGGCTRALRLAGDARRAGLGVLVTTTLDAGVGVAAALHLAAALQPLPASGLATAASLESDLLCEGIPVIEGMMRLPAGPGLGVALDGDALHRYAGPHRGEVWLDGDEP